MERKKQTFPNHLLTNFEVFMVIYWKLLIMITLTKLFGIEVIVSQYKNLNTLPLKCYQGT